MSDFSGNIARFTGFADIYDQYRPSPPKSLAPFLLTLAKIERPALVVDLGCGTGLSSRYWADQADRVIGLDPTDAMRDQAELNALPNLTYAKAFSHDTGLPDNCADIVTCSQSFHWMEPTETCHEAARILRPGGVFAAYDYDWPPVTGNWEVDAAYERCMAQGRELEKQHGIVEEIARWDKDTHLQRIRESGAFRYTQESVMHHHEPGNAERLIGLLVSQGWYGSLRKRGLTEEELGLDKLRETAQRLLGNDLRPWHWSSRIRWGIA